MPLLPRWPSWWRKYWTANVGVRLSNAPPVLVYQMGRVGSSALRNALFEAAPNPVLHFHDLIPLRQRDADAAALDDELRAGFEAEIADARAAFARLSLRERITWRARETIYTDRIHTLVARRRRPLRIVTLVREPIAANLSMFFQLFEHYAREPWREGRFTLDDLEQMFIERYPHSRPLTWFDAEFRFTTGIDVFAARFDPALGWARITDGAREVLILKSELDDAVKERVLRDFLGLPALRLPRGNVTRSKPHGRQYEALLAKLRLDPELVARVYDSKYARHFYSDDELDALRRRWTSGIGLQAPQP